MSELRHRTRNAPAVRYPVEALLRGEHAGRRSTTDTRDLVQLVHYMEEGSGIRIVLHSVGGSGRVNAWLDVFGRGAAALAGHDLRHVAALSLTLAERQLVEPEPWPSQVAFAAGLERIRMSPMFAGGADEQHPSQDWMGEAQAASPLSIAHPKPSLDASGELLAAMSRSEHDIWVVTALMAPTSLDQRIVKDEIEAAAGHGARADSTGAIVCARTLAASTGPISPAVLVALAKRSPEVESVLVESREAHALWNDPAGALQGHAVAEGYAVALARIPAAGSGVGLGIPSRFPNPVPRTLDPALPEPQTPVRLGTAVDVSGEQVEVVLDAHDLRRHVYAEGESGSGESAFLKNVGISWLATGNPLCVFDPHGDVAQAIAAHSAEGSSRVTHYIRHGDEAHPIGLNAIGGGTADTLSRNIDALLDHMQQIIDPGKDGMFGERAKRTFWIVADAARLIYGGRLTVQVVQTLLLSQKSIAQLATAVRPIDPDRARRLTAELTSLPDREWNELISWYQSRFQMWHRTQALRAITGTGIDAVDMTRVLDGDANLIVDLASPQLGDPVAGMLGGIYLRKLRDAMSTRRNRDQPVLVIFDEAHLFQDEAPDRLLAEGRKYGIALVLASQSADNLTPRLARAIEANVGSFISLRTGINLAGPASARLGGWSASELTRLPDLTAAASLSAQGIPTDAFTLHIDYYDRLRQSGRTVDDLVEAAESVAKSTLDELWLPYADIAVPTDAEILGALNPPASKSAPRPGAPIGAPKNDDDAEAVLDDWLARAASASPGSS